jgi:regulatory protein NPR1
LYDLIKTVALARIMFPMEAQLAMDLAQVDRTLEFTLGSNTNPPNGNNRSAAMDLNETPFQIKEEHHARMKALAGTGICFYGNNIYLIR